VKALAVFASAGLVLCSGCATVCHFDQPETIANAAPPPEVNAPPISKRPTNSISIASVAPDARARYWRVDEESNPWFAHFAAGAQLTLAPSGSDFAGASESSSQALNPFSKAYVCVVWDDIKTTFTAPANWDTRDWLIAGGVAASIGTVAVFDEDIQKAVQRNRNQTTDDIFKGVQGFGSEYVPGVIGAFYLGGMVFNDPEAKAVALDATSASIIAAGLALYPLKYTVGRARPGDNLGAYHFKPFSGSDSFPSGHTTEAFALATVIAEHYHSIWIDLGCYGIASAVGYARLDLNYHWASDVLAGAALGTFVGHVVVHVNHNRWGVSVQPLIEPTMKGAQLSWSF
jgi:membrane-associated phospholipid phosphatase